MGLMLFFNCVDHLTCDTLLLLLLLLPHTRHVEELGGTTSLMGLMLFFNCVDHSICDEHLLLLLHAPGM
jgi:hypothetical protein